MNHCRILGSGHYVPPTIIHNTDLEQMIETNHEWIVSRTGIQSRHISAYESTSQLAYQAAKQAIKAANIEPKEIDLIVVATITPDNFTPSCACLVQEQLGLNDNEVMAFDINAACSGFLYSLHVVATMIESKQFRCALLIGAETMSKVLNWQDRNTSILFGDGAGAVILSYDETQLSKMCHYSGSKGDGFGVLRIPSIPVRSSLSKQEAMNYFLQMDGKEVFRFAIDAMANCIDNILAKVEKSIEEIDYIIPHQANIRIIQSVIRKYKLDESKVVINLQTYGNTSAASIPLAFSELQASGKLKKGSSVILVGFGGGFTWGATYIEI